MRKLCFHLIANAHLDPVWLWDWREGLTEGVTTVRTILDLMDERPDFTFIRGESAIYQYIEATQPETFERIKQRVKEGRWEIVGGTYIQPDTNLPSTETLSRHFTHAHSYFHSRFGLTPKIAWAADSFGHSAGLPEILAKAGMKGFAFTRPVEKDLHLENTAFWWESPAGSRVLAYRPVVGWYGTERDEIPRRMDDLLEKAMQDRMVNVGCFFGVGNHGGGPTRRQLDDIQKWADKHPEVEILYSGLHRLFDALAKEERGFSSKGFPVFRGELNFCLRGCYSSVAKFKFPYRRAEAELIRAEKTDAIIAAKLQVKAQNLDEAWESILFNSFHDILPGSSIERAYEDQFSWLGVARHKAQRIEFNALTALAKQIDTSVPTVKSDHPTRVPFLVWNPHPHRYTGPIELEAPLDYRPLWNFKNREEEVPVELFDPKGKKISFQLIRTEHSSMPDLPWRKRVVFQATIPPLGWSIYELGLPEEEFKKKFAMRPKVRQTNQISNIAYQVAARIGSEGLQVSHLGKPLLGKRGLSFIKVEDPWGSWGGMVEEKKSLDLSTEIERWKIKSVEVLDSGPERSTLWVRFSGRNSQIDLTLFLSRDRPAIDVHARVLWNERSSRLKLEIPIGGDVQFEVPGGVVTRGISGEVPGGRWIKIAEKVGFASDALYNFDAVPGMLRATVVRASRYANDIETVETHELWRPAVDRGELTFRFLITADLANLPQLATVLEEPVVVQSVTPHSGILPRSGSLFEIDSKNIRLVALKPAEDQNGFILRLQETAGKTSYARATWLGKRLNLGRIAAWSLNSFRIISDNKGARSTLTSLKEEDH